MTDVGKDPISKNLLDEVDIKIISELQKDGRLSLTELGRRVGLRHSTVRERLLKIFRNKLAKIQANVNVKNLGLQIVFLAFEVSRYERVSELIRMLEACPRTILVAATSGEFNVIALMLVEDMETLRILIEKNLRPLNGIKRISINFGEIVYPEFLPIKPLTSFRSVNKSVCFECKVFSKARG